MKRILLLLACVVYSIPVVKAQGEENIWSFGNHYSLDFNTSPPTLTDQTFINGQPPLLSKGNYRNSIAVSDATGNMQFLVKLRTTGSGPLATIPCIFDRFEEPIDGTHLMNTMLPEGMPVVIPHPGNASQYYIFYVRGGALFYSLFDMTLNNGLGHIVPGLHNVVLSSYNSVNGSRMTAVRGCNGVWLVIRNILENKYSSFLVGMAGINNNAVISECGLYPVGRYYGDGITLKASPNGKMLITGLGGINAQNIIRGGVELYDFEPCSGKVKNPRLLDTGYVSAGFCFSPDNSKLYVSENETVVPTSNPPYLGNNELGHIYQYDLSLADETAIINSKTLIGTNPPTIISDPFVGCIIQSRFALGDMKLGPNGKIYLLNQSKKDACNYWGPNNSNPAMAFHVIHLPDNAGTACQLELNAIYNSWGYGNPPAMLNSSSYTELPRDLITFKMSSDTIDGQSHYLVNCFEDSIHLVAENFACYTWDNGTNDSSRVIYAPGTYYLNYYRDCTVSTDTYHVEFIELPSAQTMQYGCANDLTIKAVVPQSSNVNFQYDLKRADGLMVLSGTSKNGFAASNLLEGNYLLTISSPQGCDTVIPITLKAYPPMELVVSPADTLIRYGDSVMLNAFGAISYHWWPTAALDSATLSNPMAKPLKPTLFTVIGINEYGCMDTGRVNVNIDYSMPDMVPNAFSPNGDGINDVFRIAGTTYQKIREFNIFNRLGQRIFSTMDPRSGWDGSQKGIPCDAGTYYYLIKLDYPDGTTKTYKGDVTLVR